MLATILGVSTMLSSTAFATRIFTVHGTTCQVSSAYAGSISYTNYGIQNDSASEISVDCPLPACNSPMWLRNSRTAIGGSAARFRASKQGGTATSPRSGS
jgi:hypothetical protein